MTSICFTRYARSLNITWGDTTQYWIWEQQKDKSGTSIEVAKLKNVCWLDVSGKFYTRKLSPGILYQVSFLVMLTNDAAGWHIAPINLRLVIPGQGKQEHMEDFMNKPRDTWIEIPVGKFVASEKNVGEMEISMYEHGGHWKQGLIIQGFVVKPQN